MNRAISSLKNARLQQGWSQEQAIVRFESISRAMSIHTPARTSLRTLFSMFENEHRPVPKQYQRVFRELYRCTDSELGFSPAAVTLPVPPSLSLPLPDQASSEILDYLTNVFDQHLKADALVGPRYLVPVVQSQMTLIDHLCSTTRGSDRQGILRVATRYAEFCGWLYQDSGDSEAAVFWTDHALDYAQELNDPQNIAYSMMRKSNIVTEAGQPGHGLGLANAALNAFDVLTPQTRAVCFRQRANAYALLGEQRNFEATAEDALENAAAGAALDAADDRAIYCTPSYVSMEVGMSWVLLRQPTAAIQVFERGLSSWPAGSQTRDRGLCLARLALATAISDNTERSCQVATEALTIARSTGSARIRKQLVALHDELARHDGDASVHEVRRQLRQIS